MAYMIPSETNMDSDDEEATMEQLITRPGDASYIVDSFFRSDRPAILPPTSRGDVRLLARIEDDMDDEDMERKSKDYSNGQDWRYKIPQNMDGSRDSCRDVSLTGCWTLSSCKSDGYGIHELLNDEVDRYWQSDGPQPHTVTIEFNVKTDICFLMLYLDFKTDESYTPAKVLVQLGTSLMHLDEGREFEFNEPVGWQAIDLRTKREKPCRTFILQMQVLQNHQNGRDTHIRHIRVVGPTIPRFAASKRMTAGTAKQVRSAQAKKDPFRTTPLGKLKNKFMSSCIIR